MPELSVREAMAAGWAQTGYAVRNRSVSCPVCETLQSPHSTAETCNGCGWQPGAFPRSPEERELLADVVMRHARGRAIEVQLVAKVRRFLVGEPEKKPPFQICFVTSRQIFEEWETLVEHGLYGTPERASEELFRQAVRRELRK
jgi:hypothetical protein